MEAYIRQAVHLGLKEICFLDHLTIQPSETNLSMTPGEVPFYFQALQRLKHRYKGAINVRIGLEIDFNPAHIDFFREITARFSFDVIGGSLHFPGGLNIVSRKSSWKKGIEDSDTIYDLYLEHLKKMLDYDYFDVICHFDLVKKFGARPSKSLNTELDEILALIKRRQLTVEVNTSGYNHPAREIYPSFDVIRSCREHGIGITLGSDAHQPDQVGQHYDEVLPLLRSAGYRHLTTFHRRQRGNMAIPSVE
jgi:histidinol-phosphatase (PHP family)